MYPVEKEQVFYMVEEIKKEEFLSKPMLEKMKEVKV
jgi:hypothetical protein